MLIKRFVRSGGRFRVLGNTNSHNYKVGKVYEATNDDAGSGTCRARDPNDCSFMGNTICSKDYAVVELTREEISNQFEEVKREYEKKIKELQSMLDFMEKEPG